MNSELQLIENNDFWELSTEGRVVTRCLVDHAFTIESWESEGETVSLRIESSFVLLHRGDEQALSSGNPRELGPALIALHKEIESVKAFKAGGIQVRFSDGSVLSVKPHPDFEAWELVSSGGLRVVCNPGGGLSIWRPEEREVL